MYQLRTPVLAGAPGGFLDNSKVKIPLPPALEQVAKGMRLLGRGKDAACHVRHFQ